MTLPAAPPQLDVDRVHDAQLGHFGRNRESIQYVAGEVDDRAALAADKVMVSIRVCIEPSSVLHRAHARDNSQIFQHSQGAVYRVQRYRGDALTNSRVDGLSIGVLRGGNELSQDLGSLVGCLDALPAARIDELGDAAFDLRAVQGGLSM